ncbi:MAG: hypothetical protein WAP57_03280 [Aquabacterium commune]|uniref:hypothetical protein n=1 Tax=Aquabacterium commune TaxID=70586 RepID=UPI003BB1D5E8
MNLKRGLFRLWLALSALWLIYCGYQYYRHHSAWTSTFAAAKATTGVRESERALMIQNYMFDEKARREKMQKEGFPLLPFDEKVVHGEAFTKVEQMQSKSEEKATEDSLYREAFSERDERDSYLHWLPIAPTALAVVFSFIPWVFSGFKKSE